MTFRSFMLRAGVVAIAMILPTSWLAAQKEYVVCLVQDERCTTIHAYSFSYHDDGSLSVRYPAGEKERYAAGDYLLYSKKDEEEYLTDTCDPGRLISGRPDGIYVCVKDSTVETYLLFAPGAGWTEVPVRDSAATSSGSWFR